MKIRTSICLSKEAFEKVRDEAWKGRLSVSRVIEGLIFSMGGPVEIVKTVKKAAPEKKDEIVDTNPAVETIQDLQGKMDSMVKIPFNPMPKKAGKKK